MNGQNSMWEWDLVWSSLPDLLWGFLTVTLVVTVLGTAIATVLGLFIAVIRRSAPKPISRVMGFIVNFIRMTPIVVQLLFVYYTFTSLSPLAIGIIIFGIHYATYMSEVYRAGIDSVPPGQWEASTALSMPRGRTWFAVVIPQALRATVPALGNYAISMFKDTPFMVVIGALGLVGEAKVFGSHHFTYMEVYTLCGIIFLLASYPTSLLVARLEKRFAFKH